MSPTCLRSSPTLALTLTAPPHPTPSPLTAHHSPFTLTLTLTLTLYPQLHPNQVAGIAEMRLRPHAVARQLSEP